MLKWSEPKNKEKGCPLEEWLFEVGVFTIVGGVVIVQVTF